MTVLLSRGFSWEQAVNETEKPPQDDNDGNRGDTPEHNTHADSAEIDLKIKKKGKFGEIYLRLYAFLNSLSLKHFQASAVFIILAVVFFLTDPFIHYSTILIRIKDTYHEYAKDSHYFEGLIISKIKSKDYDGAYRSSLDSAALGNNNDDIRRLYVFSSVMSNAIYEDNGVKDGKIENISDSDVFFNYMRATEEIRCGNSEKAIHLLSLIIDTPYDEKDAFYDQKIEIKNRSHFVLSVELYKLGFFKEALSNIDTYINSNKRHSIAVEIFRNGIYANVNLGDTSASTNLLPNSAPFSFNSGLGMAAAAQTAYIAKDDLAGREYMKRAEQLNIGDNERLIYETSIAFSKLTSDQSDDDYKINSIIPDIYNKLDARLKIIDEENYHVTDCKDICFGREGMRSALHMNRGFVCLLSQLVGSRIGCDPMLDFLYLGRKLNISGDENYIDFLLTCKKLLSLPCISGSQYTEFGCTRIPDTKLVNILSSDVQKIFNLVVYKTNMMDEFSVPLVIDRRFMKIL